MVAHKSRIGNAISHTLHMGRKARVNQPPPYKRYVPKGPRNETFDADIVVQI